jgi:hypothetical protein
MIDMYMAGNHDLAMNRLIAHNWDGIVLVVEWLKQFQHATTKMSTTKLPMLSLTHTTFCGL